MRKHQYILDVGTRAASLLIEIKDHGGSPANMDTHDNYSPAVTAWFSMVMGDRNLMGSLPHSHSGHTILWMLLSPSFYALIGGSNDHFRWKFLPAWGGKLGWSCLELLQSTENEPGRSANETWECESPGCWKEVPSPPAQNTPTASQHLKEWQKEKKKKQRGEWKCLSVVYTTGSSACLQRFPPFSPFSPHSALATLLSLQPFALQPFALQFLLLAKPFSGSLHGSLPPSIQASAHRDLPGPVWVKEIHTSPPFLHLSFSTFFLSLPLPISYSAFFFSSLRLPLLEICLFASSYFLLTVFPAH